MSRLSNNASLSRLSIHMKMQQQARVSQQRPSVGWTSALKQPKPPKVTELTKKSPIGIKPDALTVIGDPIRFRTNPLMLRPIMLPQIQRERSRADNARYLTEQSPVQRRKLDERAFSILRSSLKLNRNKSTVSVQTLLSEHMSEMRSPPQAQPG